MTMRTYTELCMLDTLEDRFDYLALNGAVGDTTFGSSRYVKQSFYRSREWRNVRNLVILRDIGELGLEEYPIRGAPAIHHMNPLTMDDFAEMTDNLLHPEYLILVSHKMHNAVHFGDRSLIPKPFVERQPGDTKLW